MQDVHARAEVLAALEAVDLVVVFEQDTPLELIRRVRPKVLVKGGDYRREQVVGHEIVEARRRRGDPGRSRARLQHDPAGAQIARAAVDVMSDRDSRRRRGPMDASRSWCASSSVAARSGFFVEVGANRPRFASQTWHLEQLGWTGVLIEPQPDLAAELRRQRTARSSRSPARRLTMRAACGRCTSPARCRRSTATAWRRVPSRSGSSRCRCARSTIFWPRRRRRSPSISCRSTSKATSSRCSAASTSRAGGRALILLEDHVGSLARHRFLKGAGYRLIRRFENNGWYVPNDAPVEVGWRERWEIVRKYYLALPFRIARNASRSVRRRLKEWMRPRG